jgi:hypothetical protein
MIDSASKAQPFLPRTDELRPRQAGNTPGGPRSVFQGWGPKL